MSQKAELESAAPRPMSHEEALRFVVKLANTDIDELIKTPDDPSGIPTILYELSRYLGLEKGERLKARNDDLKKVIADIKRILDAVAEGRWQDTKFHLRKPRVSILRVEGDELVAAYRGIDLREATMIRLFNELSNTKLDLLRIGRCQRSGCSKLFYKVKTNQAYCDHRCANLAAASRRRGKAS